MSYTQTIPLKEIAISAAAIMIFTCVNMKDFIIGSMRP